MKKVSVDKVSKTSSKLLLAILAIMFIAIIGIIGIFMYNTLPIDSNSTETVDFKIESGWTSSKIAKELEQKGLIRDDDVFKVYIRISKISDFKAGNFKLSKSMNIDEIVNILTDSKNALVDSITITFLEGKNYLYFMDKIAENFNYTKEELIEYTSKEAYLKGLIDKYWFIDESILNKDIYYPLEGYLFPDTYQFNKDSSIDTIMDTLLGAMDKNLSAYKEEIQLSGKSIHSLLTLASVIELEAVTPEDRLEVAGVFENRLNSNMALGSDVTTYYGVKKQMKDSLTMSDLNNCNAYNTREVCNILVPVGPICSSAYSSIIAAIKPNKNNYYFFVADTNNKVYFGVTYNDHINIINKLKRSGLWPE